MSRNVSPFQAPCHDGEEWTCAICKQIQCRRCDGIPSDDDEPVCWACFNTEDPDGDEAA